MQGLGLAGGAPQLDIDRVQGLERQFPAAMSRAARTHEELSAPEPLSDA